MSITVVRERRNVAELRHWNRQDEMKAICQFIDTCDFDELATIIEEIRCCHDNLMAFNPDTGLLAKIESTAINGECIQLNIEKDAEQKREGAYSPSHPTKEYHEKVS